jgi:HAD superfamily hydrolase (TIGR01509 family)
VAVLTNLGVVSPTELVIFDCDGVLVDSEPTAVKVDREVLRMVGIELSEAEIVERFVGRSTSVMDAMIEEHLGGPIPRSLKQTFDRMYLDAFETTLAAVDGVADALERIHQPVCVASSSTSESLRHKLELTGLHDRFDGHAYSATQVRRGKPAPDLFLFAAEQMGVAPARCVVVEDSPYGLQAARAARMRALAYDGGFVDRTRLRLEDVMVFDDMRLLPELL